MAKPSLTRPPTAKPVTPLPSVALQGALDCAHLAMERLNKVIHVAVVALYGQDCDIDSAVATCLEAAVTAELEPARKSIEEALALLQEVANG